MHVHTLTGTAPPRLASRRRRMGRTTATRPAVRSRDGSCEALFLEHLEFVERTVASLARRYAVKPWDAEDLAGQVKLRLLADDYAVLRKFRGQSRLTTYLTTVIHNIFRDFRIQRWGKWRPSAAAKRLGDLGVQMEALLYRDRFTTAESIEILRERFAVTATDEQLWTLAEQLRPRTTRRFESEAALALLESTERADQVWLDSERRRTLARAEGALRRVLDALEPEDRLILKMRFADSLTIRSIAEALDLEPRRMYTRLQRLLDEVRRRIEEQGVGCDEVLDLLNRPAEELEAGLGAGAGAAAAAG